jgi:hypothetical protein
MVFPVFWVVWLFYRRRKVKKYLKSKLVNFYGKDELFSLIVMPTTARVSAVFICYLLSWPLIWYAGIGLGITSLWLNALFVTVIALLYGLLVLFLTVFFPAKTVVQVEQRSDLNASWKKVNLNQFHQDTKIDVPIQARIPAVSEIDRNDVEIVALHGEMTSITHQVETYILESVFFSALTFSGLISILTSDKLSVIGTDTNAPLPFLELLEVLGQLGGELLRFNDASILALTEQLTQDRYLFSLLAYESVICSSFFLLVLAGRLSYASISKQAGYFTELAREFNAKEEDALNLTLDNNGVEAKQRLARLSKDTALYLTMAESAARQVNNIFLYLRTMRATGIFFFYLILVTSGLYFHNSMPLVILAFIGVGYILKSLLRLISRLEVPIDVPTGESQEASAE